MHIQNLMHLSLEFQKSACLFTFFSGNFLPTVHEHMFYVFVLKVQNEQGIVPSLEVGIEVIAIRIISFRHPCKLLI